MHEEAAGLGGGSLFSLQSCSPVSAGCQRLYLPNTFFPFYFSSASHDYLPFVHSHPHPTPTPSPQTLEMDGGFLVRTWESSKAIQHPWKCNHFWGGIPVMGLLGSALGAPLPVCPLLTKGTGLGFPLPSISKPCLWT